MFTGWECLIFGRLKLLPENPPHAEAQEPVPRTEMLRGEPAKDGLYGCLASMAEEQRASTRSAS